MIARLLNHLTKIDVEGGNQGELKKEEFCNAVAEYMEGLTQQVMDGESLATLGKAAETELEAKDVETLEYKNLFMEVCIVRACVIYYPLLVGKVTMKYTTLL